MSRTSAWATPLLDIAFFGPAAKLLCLRRNRPHPWILGTGFHQSCGAELRNVVWQTTDNTLRGELHRPAGEQGALFFTDAGRRIAGCEVDGQPIFPQRTANGAWRMEICVRAAPTIWRIDFE